MTASRVIRSSTGRTVRRAVSTPNRTSAAASGSADARCHGRGAAWLAERPHQVRREHADPDDHLRDPEHVRPVPAHHRAVPDRVRAEAGQLGVPLGHGHAERAEAADQQEPDGRRHVRRGRAAEHPQHEPGRHDQHLEERDVLEPERVKERRAQVGRRRGDEQRLADHHAGPDREQRREHGEHDRVLLGQRARGDRPVPLHRVPPVPLHVDDVVDEVHRRRRAAEGEHGQQRVAEAVIAAERRARQRRREHQQVLRPLPGPGRPDGRARPARRRERRDRRSGHRRPVAPCPRQGPPSC